MKLKLNRFSIVLSSALLACATFVSNAQPYDPGATDKEIKIGNTNPYSGPFSAYGSFGKAQAGYFKKLNDEGGITGRKINFITVDDGFAPPKTLRVAR